MFCMKCGRAVGEDERFCPNCGAENVLYGGGAPSVQGQPAQKGKGKKAPLLIALGAAAVVAILAIVLLTGNTGRVKLPYAWGTSLEKFQERETMFSYESGVRDELWFSRQASEGPSVDVLTGFTTEYVYFGFQKDKLVEMDCRYEENYDSPHSRRMVLEKQLGKKYYSFGGEDNDEATDVWWIGDTVVIVDYCEISYYSAAYFKGEDCRDEFYYEWERIMDFFDK